MILMPRNLKNLKILNECAIKKTFIDWKFRYNDWKKFIKGR